jgi:hypothetical protein
VLLSFLHQLSSLRDCNDALVVIVREQSRLAQRRHHQASLGKPQKAHPLQAAEAMTTELNEPGTNTQV